MIFHYIPASSVEIAAFYQPLLDPAGREVGMAEAADGGPCGVGWSTAGH